MAATQDNQYAADAEFDGRPAGVFTHYAIEALEGLRVGAKYLDRERQRTVATTLGLGLGHLRQTTASRRLSRCLNDRSDRG